MKLFEHTQQTTHSKADLKQLKDIAIETLHESSRYVEAYNDTTTALGLLKRLETQGDTSSPVMKLAYESINDQLGYEEGTRLSAEFIGSAITDFGKRMWDKVLAAWDAVSKWSSGIMDRFKSKPEKGKMAKMLMNDSRLTRDELVERFVIDPNKHAEPNAPFNPYAEDGDFLNGIESFISNSTNLKDTESLMQQVETITKDYATSQQLPSDLTTLYRTTDDSVYVEEQIMDALEGNIEPVEVLTLKKKFTFFKDEVGISAGTADSKREHWNFKENNSEIGDIEHLYNVQIGMVSVLKDTDKFMPKVSPIIVQLTKDKKTISELLDFISDCRSRVVTLSVIAAAAIGK